MITLNVQSLPIKEVLNDIADQLNVAVTEDCEIYSLTLPKHLGSGMISGVNFPNGVAWLNYICRFEVDVTIRFTVNETHPMKMLYNLGTSIRHTFENSDEVHVAERYQNLIVASKKHKGHVLHFPKKTQIKLNSVEIDREVFKDNWTCDVNNLNSNLKTALLDYRANEAYVYHGPYSLRVAQVFQSISSFDQKQFIKKMFLASKSFELIAQQLSDYGNEGKDVSLPDDESLKVLNAVEELIESDLRSYVTVRALSHKLKISENNLQKIFKLNTGLTGNEYIKNKRMEYIVDLLENTKLSIGEISKLVGIDSASYLSKIFKEKYNLTPVEFRSKRSDHS